MNGILHSCILKLYIQLAILLFHHGRKASATKFLIVFFNFTDELK
jgi:hypothetical protein